MSIRDELLNQLNELEPLPEEVRARVYEEIVDVSGRPLKAWQRVFWLLACVAMVGMLIGAIWVVTESEKLYQSPVYIMIVFACACLLLLGVFFAGLKTVIKGSAQSPALWEGLLQAAFAFLALFVGYEILTGAPVSSMDVVPLVVVGVGVVFERINAMELRLRKRLLRSDLQLLKLGERLERKERAAS